MNNLKDRVTIYEVAKASGVSLATVSRVINNQGNVTAQTKAKVEATIARLGYKPSSLAQALATNRSTLIGVVVPSANYVYIANLLNGIMESAKEKGFLLSIFTTSHNKEEARKIVERVITSHVDGAIIFDDELSEEDVNKISSYNVPTIVINNKIVGDKVGCVYFGVEHMLKKILAMELTRTSGSKKVTFIHLNDAGQLLVRMERAAFDLHELLGKECISLEMDDSYTKTYNFFNEYFKKNKSGYFIAYRDSLAAAVLNAATYNGLKVPEDVEVLSIIGTKYANIIRPTISSMMLDFQEVGRKSMHMLSDLIDHKLEEKSFKFESSYIKRNSTID